MYCVVYYVFMLCVVMSVAFFCAYLFNVCTPCCVFHTCCIYCVCLMCVACVLCVVLFCVVHVLHMYYVFCVLCVVSIVCVICYILCKDVPVDVCQGHHMCAS